MKMNRFVIKKEDEKYQGMISRKITDKINVDTEGDYLRCGIDDTILMMKGLDFKEYIFDECHKVRKVKVKVEG